MQSCNLQLVLDISWYLLTYLPTWVSWKLKLKNPPTGETKKTRGAGRQNGQDPTMFAI